MNLLLKILLQSCYFNLSLPISRWVCCLYDMCDVLILNPAQFCFRLQIASSVDKWCSAKTPKDACIFRDIFLSVVESNN